MVGPHDAREVMRKQPLLEKAVLLQVGEVTDRQVKRPRSFLGRGLSRDIQY